MVTAASRAGLNFAPPRAKRILKLYKPDGMKQSANAAVSLAAILEYFTAEVLEQANLKAKESGRKRITPRHIKLAIDEDSDLRQIVGRQTMKNGGYNARYNKEAASRREKKRRKRTDKTKVEETE
jgi:histone H2A